MKEGMVIETFVLLLQAPSTCTRQERGRTIRGYNNNVTTRAREKSRTQEPTQTAWQLQQRSFTNQGPTMAMGGGQGGWYEGGEEVATEEVGW